MHAQMSLMFAILTALPQSSADQKPSASVEKAVQTDGVVELLFLYGSEKRKWVDAVTSRFNDSGRRLSNGEKVKVKAVAAGSGEQVDDVLNGRIKAHLLSPAAGVFIARGNADSIENKLGSLVGPTRELVSSPIVVAMWREMAEAIGWPGKSLRWHEIFEYARKPARWRQVAKPEWGEFKFGHTHPEYSNSGIHALFAETYAALGKFDGVSRADVNGDFDKVSRYIKDVEGTVNHYGKSTGFLGEKMFSQGPSYLTAAILYESQVIEANKEFRKKEGGEQPRVVAVYPAEGTFPSEHPVGVVNREWVTEKHKEAAELYIHYLLDRPQQEEALAFGFRPADETVDRSSLLKPEFGVDNKQRVPLSPPRPTAIRLILNIWKLSKRNADIVLAIDTSASMEGEKIVSAEKAATDFIELLGPNDSISTLIFGSDVEWMKKDISIDHEGREKAKESIKGLLADGDTALYDAIEQAYDHLSTHSSKKTRAVVVLSDGKDTKRADALEKLIAKFQSKNQRDSIFVFTIGYGADADPETLKRISKQTKGSYYQGKVDTIREVFKEIATFF